MNGRMKTCEGMKGRIDGWWNGEMGREMDGEMQGDRTTRSSNC